MIVSRDVRLGDGRVVRAHDSGLDRPEAVVVWHHGSPQTGALLEPLLLAAAERGIRLLSYGRPGYGGSSRLVGRDVVSAARDVEQVADAFGVDRFAVMGASGGGPHALACAAVLPERVSGVVCLAGMAPFTEEFDWYAGMAAPGGLRAAEQGLAARERFTEEFDPSSFTPADWAALSGQWTSLGADAQRAEQAGGEGLVDDDLAFVRPWGFDLAEVTAPVLLVQGGQDRVAPPSHADWLRGRLPRAELWPRPEDGHISVLHACAEAMDWLRAGPMS
ncbi:alpha/beta hydrolase [Kutzneria viridogrisea]|uniref:Pimeloyl-ACP methyl ester carboxylesterase n=1 Tax=Kutzneria viridogrisea TaxID=47990 RepID=A0ABR6BGJ5_9PSEU|nr:pimeloyl-ACP methyl ester carboxylesterase [Kutzneria viridogrisea]